MDAMSDSAPLPLDQRVAQLEVLLARLEGKSTTSSAELLSRQEHLDECIDEVKEEVAKHGVALDAQGVQLGRMVAELEEVDDRMDRIEANQKAHANAIGFVATAVDETKKQVRWSGLLVAGVTGGVQAAVVTVLMVGRSLHWFAAVVALGLLSACGLPADTVREIKLAAQGAHAIVLDRRSTEAERETAVTCYDVLTDVLYATGEIKELPADVRARMEQRNKRRAEGSASVAEGGSR